MGGYHVSYGEKSIQESVPSENGISGGGICYRDLRDAVFCFMDTFPPGLDGTRFQFGG